jgi:hypothetical protein
MTPIMSDAPAVVGEEVDIVQVTPPAATPFSWSAAIAGALTATAIAFIVVSLGSGIGLSIASPYHAGPSAATLTVMGAVWLVMAQALGFACGGYLAARIRRRAADDAGEETRFRDAAHGLVVWALGVAVAALLVGIAASYPLSAVSNAALGAASSNSQEAKDGLTSYFVDLLFRPARAPQGSQAAAAPAASSNPTADQTRAEATRIVDRGIAQGGLNDSDRAYLAQLVAQRTGMSPDEATGRVTDVENQARDTVKQAADKAAKAGAFLSFWTFMSLLFGGAAAVLGGMLGGEIRDGDEAWSPTVQPR